MTANFDLPALAGGVGEAEVGLLFHGAHCHAFKSAAAWASFFNLPKPTWPSSMEGHPLSLFGLQSKQPARRSLGRRRLWFMFSAVRRRWSCAVV
jgi:hypothetical protein